ncbi:hypothetical protein ATN38_01490 [Rhodococcus sp. FH8]|nr:hypothetical protein Rwratislav_27249 [Rhodococcus wratislaviensis IFP 2016]MBW0285754.1 hypothetical protein [Rhodococcus sp. FH8]
MGGASTTVATAARSSVVRLAGNPICGHSAVRVTVRAGAGSQYSGSLRKVQIPVAVAWRSGRGK